MSAPVAEDRFVIGGPLRDFVANVLGHTAGLTVREGERLRALLPVESAGLLRELMSLPRAAGGDGRAGPEGSGHGGGEP